MKLPLFAVILILVAVGFLFAKSAASVIRFSANVLTWIVIFGIIICGAWVFQDSESKDESGGRTYEYESKRNDNQLR